jgi:galactofuranose transport system ATP-binding protein
MSATEAASLAPILSMRGIDKSFAGVHALVGASIEVAPGEAMALVGQNGAGKSTLIKVLTGVHRKDGGEIHLLGRSVEFASPQEAQRAGVSTIYQEINLIPYRSAAENICLGNEPRRYGFIDWKQMNAAAEEVLRRFSVDIDVKRPLMSFSTAIQQMVAIARAVSFSARLVIMDEPTSSLDDREVEVLFDVIRKLKRDGVSVIFVSHRLDELYQVCERVTVMRDGRTVMVDALVNVDKLQLVAAMLGRDLAAVRAKGATAFTHKETAAGGEVMRAEDLRIGRRVRNAHVAVRAGEIVGLAGLLGSGRTEVARAIFGADPPDEGRVILGGELANPRAPAEAIARGVGFCTEDRKTEGIVPNMSVAENLTLALLPRLTHAGIVDEGKQREVVARFVTRLGVKLASTDQKIRELSGGNQQKVLLARWLCTDPKLLIMDEPTRGIDVGAKGEIQSLIAELAEQGLGVLMISSELEEIVEGAGRVFVLRDGETAAELTAEAINEATIMSTMAHGAEEGGMIVERGNG